VLSVIVRNLRGTWTSVWRHHPTCPHPRAPTSGVRQTCLTRAGSRPYPPTAAHPQQGGYAVESNSKISLPGPVTDVRRRMELWRKTRPKRGPIPEVLWREAAQLAGLHGVNPIARALRLDYYALKRHLEETGRPQETARPAAAFVEVAVCPSTPASDCVVEMERLDGARMRVRLANQGDLVALTESFWRCRA